MNCHFLAEFLDTDFLLLLLLSEPLSLFCLFWVFSLASGKVFPFDKALLRLFYGPYIEPELEKFTVFYEVIGVLALGAFLLGDIRPL